MASHDIVAPEAQPVVGPRVTNSWVLALKNMVTVRPKVLEVVLLLAVFYLLSWASARYGPSTGQQSAALDVVTKSLDRAIRDALLFR